MLEILDGEQERVRVYPSGAEEHAYCAETPVSSARAANSSGRAPRCPMMAARPIFVIPLHVLVRMHSAGGESVVQHEA